MSQHDFDIATADANTGTTMRTAINAALQALAGASSGATSPATPYAFQLWADTTTNTLKMRNGGNTAWLVILPDLAAAYGGLAFLNLADVPTSYSGQTGKFLRVNTTSDAMEFAAVSGVSPIRASVYRSTVQSIPNNAWTAIIFDTEIYDTDGMATLGTNPDRITITQDGYYDVYANVTFDSTASFSRGINIWKNGAAMVPEPRTGGSQASLRWPMTITASGIPLVAGDYLQLRVLHLRGSATDVGLAPGTWPTMTVQKVT